MARTTNLRRQHDEAMRLVGEIQLSIEILNARPDRAAALDVSMLLARLTGLLRIHFAQEDCHLYPSLMASGRGGVADVARRFFEEMGQIGPVFGQFVQQWNTPDAIQADPRRFTAEAASLFKALGDRIARENEELYPLADAQAQKDNDAPRAA